MEGYSYGAALSELRATAEVVLAPQVALDDVDDSQLEALLDRSQAVENEAAQNLHAGEGEVRELAALQLAGGAALDLALAADLFDAPGGGAALAAGPSRFEQVNAELETILGAPSAVGIRVLGGTRAPAVAAQDFPEPLERLDRASSDAIDSISGDAQAIAGNALGGLVQLGPDALLGAFGQAADRLLSKVYAAAQRFVRAAVKMIVKAVSKLLRLLGPLEPKVRKWLGEKLAGLTGDKLTGWAVDAVLETPRLRDDVAQRIAAASATADRDRLDAASAEVGSLAARFGRHKFVIEVLAKVLGWVAPKLVALATWAAAAVAGVYVLILGYGVWAGGDYLDWYRTRVDGRLDMVDGVRTTVVAALSPGEA